MTSHLITTLVALLLFVVQSAVAEDAPIILNWEEIPPNESRQQALLNYREYRFAYSLTPTPFSSLLFAECFVDGQLVRRVRLSSVYHWKMEEYSKGYISVGWIPHSKEIVAINDNGYGYAGFWSARAKLQSDVFDSPSQVIYSSKPSLESRKGVGDNHAPINVYPIIGIAGERGLMTKSRIGPLSSTATFLHEAKSDHVRRCVVVYIYFEASGGEPPLHFDKPETPQNATNIRPAKHD